MTAQTTTRSRSRALHFAALLAGLLLLGLAVQPQSAPAEVRAAGLGDSPIEHVVVIYQENHSFDETLGFLCRHRPTPCDGHVGNVTLKDGSTVRMRVSPDVVPLAAHWAHAQSLAINGGAMDGWAEMGGCKSRQHLCLTFYKPSQFPNMAALANNFVVSDRTFEMAQSPSWGGHIYPVAATMDGFIGDTPKPIKSVPRGRGWGCDSNRVAAWVSPSGELRRVPSCIPFADGSGTFQPTPVEHVPTIFDRLEAANKSWKIYGATPPVGDGESPGYIWSICPTFADCIYTERANNLVPTAKILNAAENGQLPKYSIVTPSASGDALVGTKSSQHNGTSMMAGDNLIGQIVSAIENGPDWDTTAIFISYDDCGCFYDHVPPPMNPDGTMAGVRVPMVIISPWVKQGYTDSNTATMGSTLAFTEHVFDLEPLGVNDAGAYDYADSFDFTQTPLEGIPLEDHPIPQSSIDYVNSLPADFWDEEEARTVSKEDVDAYLAAMASDPSR